MSESEDEDEEGAAEAAAQAAAVAAAQADGANVVLESASRPGGGAGPGRMRTGLGVRVCTHLETGTSRPSAGPHVVRIQHVLLSSVLMHACMHAIVCAGALQGLSSM